MIRTLLVDDEAPALDRLKKLLKAYPDIQVINEVQDGLTALSLIEKERPDLVFLDIDMPELSGLDVAKTIGMTGPLIVFATAYDEYALEAFESNAIDYVVKPINTSRLDITVEKIRRSLQSGKKTSLQSLTTSLQKDGTSRLAVKIGSKYEVFDPSSISAAIASNHYTSLIVDGRELLSDESLESVHLRLDEKIFIRVHRSAIVNIKFIKELKREGDRKYMAILNDKVRTQVPISRERLPQVKMILGLL